MGYPRPLQERIPILVGGNGERRTLRLAARYADACNVIGEVDVVRRKVAALHAHCASLDRDPAEVEVTQLSTTLVGRDGAEVAELVERLRPRKRHAERYAASVNAGTVDDQIGRFRALADAGVGTAIVSLPDLEGDTSPLERFASVDRRVHADPASAKLARLRARAIANREQRRSSSSFRSDTGARS